MSHRGTWKFMALVVAAVAIAVAACGDSNTRNPEITVHVRGTVYDWETGAPLPSAIVATVGISAVQTATTNTDGEFDLQAVPIHGFILLNVSAAGHVRTISAPVLVGDENLDGVTTSVLGNIQAAALKTGFGVTTTAGRGVILGQTATAANDGIAGVASVSLTPAGVKFNGPRFVDANGDPGSGTSTSADGGFVFFNVSTGDVGVRATATDLVFEDQATVIINNAWSLVTLVGDGPGVGGSPTPVPTGTPAPQSFATDIVPIFSSRGCTGAGCHRPPSPGGGLRLNQSADQIYPAVLQRTNTVDPAFSPLLTKPLFEATPNHTGGNIFLTTSDPDYQRILRWIADGAPNN